MWDFLKPTRPKLWIAGILLASYWLVGKIDSLVAFPLVNVFYPDYFSRLMETMQPQTEKLMTLMGQDAMGVTNLFLAVHITVAATVGYLGACLIVLLVKNGKAI
jgi:hypothetical protein